MRVDDGLRLRQRVFALVVVRDDEIDAERPAERRLLIGGDAAVHGHDERDALGRERADRGLVGARSPPPYRAGI